MQERCAALAETAATASLSACKANLDPTFKSAEPNATSNTNNRSENPERSRSRSRL